MLNLKKSQKQQDQENAQFILKEMLNSIAKIAKGLYVDIVDSKELIIEVYKVNIKLMIYMLPWVKQTRIKILIMKIKKDWDILI